MAWMGLGQASGGQIAALERELAALRTERVKVEEKISRVKRGLPPEPPPAPPKQQSLLPEIPALGDSSAPLLVAAAVVAGWLVLRSR